MYHFAERAGLSGNALFRQSARYGAVIESMWNTASTGTVNVPPSYGSPVSNCTPI